MEHLLFRSKCSIFHNIFKYMIFQRPQKAFIMENGLRQVFKVALRISYLKVFLKETSPDLFKSGSSSSSSSSFSWPFLLSELQHNKDTIKMSIIHAT